MQKQYPQLKVINIPFYYDSKLACASMVCGDDRLRFVIPFYIQIKKASTFEVLAYLCCLFLTSFGLGFPKISGYNIFNLSMFTCLNKSISWRM